MYNFGSRVRYSETDEYGKLTLTGILNYLQDCSTFQSEDNGLGISYLNESHKAWWLSSWQIVVDRYPALGEEIDVSTWPYAFKGFYGYRNFTICDKKGKYLVRANSVWFLFDTEKDRPVKIQPEDIRGYGVGTEEMLSMEYAPRKILVSEDYTISEPVMVSKHHIDTNHHVNNAKYVEIAREVLPAELEVKELRVEYKKAAVFGDAVYPRISPTKEGYVVSLCDGEGSAYAVVWLRGTTERK
ncbi:acyl-ACP thioesterase domain-containing protein [Clostridium sp. HBUAS56010]|uniref:acyl-[acyl-carrier-protein] thioesterase n=1 Tax=Clostridium sp. HBUAS56010 TaxID=2571127 RepID=UPI00117795A0|nr:acyl-ACP thioesterase domain-containing protein [Clostridium sp. HBUAS56010]